MASPTKNSSRKVGRPEANEVTINHIICYGEESRKSIPKINLKTWSDLHMNNRIIKDFKVSRHENSYDKIRELCGFDWTIYNVKSGKPIEVPDKPDFVSIKTNITKSHRRLYIGPITRGINSSSTTNSVDAVAGSSSVHNTIPEGNPDDYICYSSDNNINPYEGIPDDYINSSSTNPVGAVAGPSSVHNTIPEGNPDDYIDSSYYSSDNNINPYEGFPDDYIDLSSINPVDAVINKEILNFTYQPSSSFANNAVHVNASGGIPYQSSSSFTNNAVHVNASGGIPYQPSSSFINNAVHVNASGGIPYQPSSSFTNNAVHVNANGEIINLSHQPSSPFANNAVHVNANGEFVNLSHQPSSSFINNAVHVDASGEIINSPHQPYSSANNANSYYANQWIKENSNDGPIMHPTNEGITNSPHQSSSSPAFIYVSDYELLDLNQRINFDPPQQPIEYSNNEYMINGMADVFNQREKF